MDAATERDVDHRLRSHEVCPECACASIRRETTDEQRGYVMATCRRCGHGWDECWRSAPRVAASSMTAFIADDGQWRELGTVTSIELDPCTCLSDAPYRDPECPTHGSRQRQLIAVRPHLELSVRLKRRQARRLLKLIGWQSPPIPAKAAHKRRYGRG